MWGFLKGLFCKKEAVEALECEGCGNDFRYEKEPFEIYVCWICGSVYCSCCAKNLNKNRCNKMLNGGPIRPYYKCGGELTPRVK